jgi:hypothetical protein
MVRRVCVANTKGMDRGIYTASVIEWIGFSLASNRGMNRGDYIASIMVMFRGVLIARSIGMVERCIQPQL